MHGNPSFIWWSRLEIWNLKVWRGTNFLSRVQIGSGSSDKTTYRFKRRYRACSSPAADDDMVKLFFLPSFFLDLVLIASKRSDGSRSDSFCCRTGRGRRVWPSTTYPSRILRSTKSNTRSVSLLLLSPPHLISSSKGTLTSGWSLGSSVGGQ